ncbi:MAG: excisionase [Burkholderiaceae bacterium]
MTKLNNTAAPESAMMVSPAPYVTVKLAAAITGMSEKAIRRKMEDGKWLQDREYRRTPDGCIMVSMKGFQKWVEQATM